MVPKKNIIKTIQLCANSQRLKLYYESKYRAQAHKIIIDIKARDDHLEFWINWPRLWTIKKAHIKISIKNVFWPNFKFFSLMFLVFSSSVHLYFILFFFLAEFFLIFAIFGVSVDYILHNYFYGLFCLVNQLFNSILFI